MTSPSNIGAFHTPVLRGLVGDIGGTNARFAIAERKDGKTTLSHFKSLECAAYKDVYDALRAYFVMTGEAARFDFTVVAVAGPVCWARRPARGIHG